MPVCVHCNAPAPYVYTVYRSKDNVRLKVCVSLRLCISQLLAKSLTPFGTAQDTCQQFADPLIEHPLVLLLIDLILLKPRVYRHLIFNRGSSPYRASRILLPGKDDMKAGVQGNGKNGTDSGESEHVEKLRVTKVNHDRRNVSSSFPVISNITHHSLDHLASNLTPRGGDHVC